MKSKITSLRLRENAKLNTTQEGLTLIELLVTVIIVGILASIALPNLLSQIGRSRDAELRNTVGTITRAQHGFHFEHMVFTNSLAALGVTVTTQYQSTPAVNTDTTTQASILTNSPKFSENQTRAYASRIGFTLATSDYDFIFCASRVPAANMVAPPDATNCPAGSDVIR